MSLPGRFVGDPASLARNNIFYQSLFIAGSSSSDWETFDDPDPSLDLNMKRGASADNDSGLVSDKIDFSSNVIGAGAFQSSDLGTRAGRLNKWYLFSMIFDRILLVGFIALIVVMLIAYTIMRD